MPKDVFSGRLREALERSGLTQAQLGAATGCSQEDISRYLQGRIPGGERLIVMAKALGTTAEELVGEERKPAEALGEAFQRRNYDQAMAELRRIRKSLAAVGKITESLAKLEGILGRSAGIRAGKEGDRSAGRRRKRKNLK